MPMFQPYPGENPMAARRRVLANLLGLPSQGRGLPYQLPGIGYEQTGGSMRLSTPGPFGSMLGLPTDERVFSDSSASPVARRISAARQRPAGVPRGTRMLSDTLRGGQVPMQPKQQAFGSQGNQLAEMLRMLIAPETAMPGNVADTTGTEMAQGMGSPFEDVEQMPPSVTGRDENPVLRQLADAVVNGLLSMSEAGQRYRATRFPQSPERQAPWDPPGANLR